MERARHQPALLLHLVRPGLFRRIDEALGEEVDHRLQASDLVRRANETGPRVDQFDAEVKQSEDPRQFLAHRGAGRLVLDDEAVDLVFLAIASDAGDQLMEPVPVGPAIEKDDLGIAGLVAEDAPDRERRRIVFFLFGVGRIQGRQNIFAVG